MASVNDPWARREQAGIGCGDVGLAAGRSPRRGSQPAAMVSLRDACRPVAAELRSRDPSETLGSPQPELLDVLERLLDPLEILTWLVEFLVEGLGR